MLGQYFLHQILGTFNVKLNCQESLLRGSNVWAGTRKDDYTRLRKGTFKISQGPVKTSWTGNSWVVSQKVKIEIPYDLAISLLGIYSKELETYVHTKACIQIYIAALFMEYHTKYIYKITILDIGDTVVNETHKNACPHGAYTLLGGEAVNKNDR